MTTSSNDFKQTEEFFLKKEKHQRAFLNLGPAIQTTADNFNRTVSPSPIYSYSEVNASKRHTMTQFLYFMGEIRKGIFNSMQQPILLN